MKIKLVGASGGEVTGSAYVVRTKRATIMVDAGMFQGGRQSEAKNRLPSGVRPDECQAVLLTHAHLDHSGRLPLLIKHGFSGPVYATAATIDLAELILKDCARIQSQDAERKTRKAARNDLPPVEPLYEPEDVEPFRSLARKVQFQKPVEVAEGISARWVEAGHMLGSGCIELTVDEDGRKKVVVFSGDLGPTTLPLIREYQIFDRADAVFLESTYGDRLHRPYAQTVAEFERIVKQVAKGTGKILVPTFAIGRSQQMLYHLAIMFLRKDIRPFPVFLDSPMALEATKIYRKYPDLFDDELIAWQKKGLLPLNRSIFKPSVTANDSKKINDVPGPCVVLAGAGMCNAGRILHHLKFNLDNPTTHVLIVGFQGHGSLGRRLVEGQKVVTIFGERIPVRASVHTLNGFSGHADQGELLKWFSTLAPAKPKVILTHGEDRGRGALARLIQQRFKLTAALPKQGDVIEI
ncbi:MAG TPA: MBL fold metallo-hydrolase [Pirellulaceae bacterium]|nr:MBL fold metallo-hydrolase [Pirellulaceae bacterium]